MAQENDPKTNLVGNFLPYLSLPSQGKLIRLSKELLSDIDFKDWIRFALVSSIKFKNNNLKTAKLEQQEFDISRCSLWPIQLWNARPWTRNNTENHFYLIDATSGPYFSF